ncbi:GNAT family N-acetyltransferase [Qipengyuania spongiae]|uniref:GNAT family N-acetyltransferase n=1 Tax=Qipengyuania spongiae TaxID=2909673 RepID=A0ABY5SWU0_9SPHN|nr:GNAT family N-acetyltransferase [Qipengyuania spongiae]UVI38992.1 GNAT family N-acetyltransferase [Qipengyuania spongiae]
MNAISYHDTVGKLQAPDFAPRGPFDALEWYALLEKHGARPVLAEVGKGATRLVLPLSESSDGMASLRHPFAFVWRPLALSGEASDAALVSTARALRGRTHRIVLDALPGEDATGERLAAAFRKAGWIVRLEQSDQNHVLETGGRSFAEYWASRPGPLRTTVKRKAKKVEIAIAEHFDPDIWAEYRRIYDLSWKTREADIALLEDFARQEAAAGHLRLGIARLGETPVAAQLWSVQDGTAYIHKLAHDEAFRHLSAGTTLSAALFEHVIDRDRVRLIDFGTGGDAYKRDWMERVRARHTLTCVDPRQWRGLRFLLRKAAARLARPRRQG